MATTTFDKRIIIDDKAADIMIALLNKPAPPRPNTNGKFRKMTEEDLECFLRKHSENLSEQKVKNV